MKQFLSACLAVLLLAVLLVLPAAAEETTDAPNLTPGFSVTAEAALRPRGKPPAADPR